MRLKDGVRLINFDNKKFFLTCHLVRNIVYKCFLFCSCTIYFKLSCSILIT